MSTMIVSTLTTKEPEDVLTVAGNRTLKLDRLQSYLGREVDTDLIPNVVDSIEEAAARDIIVDSTAGTVSFKTSTGFVNVVGSVEGSPIGFMQQYTAPLYTVTTNWTNLPFYPNLFTGVHILNIVVKDGNDKMAVYSGQIPFISESDQAVLGVDTESVVLTRQGEDDATLSLQIVRDPATTPKIRMQIKGDVAPLLAYKEMTFKFRLVA